ncbi:unnamed protein product [Ixodes hexagonus]
MSAPFSAWDYRHYSLLHAEEEATYYNQFIQLLENKCLAPQPAARGRPRGSLSERTPEEAPRFSSLSSREHLLYLRLLQIYQHKVVSKPTALEQQEIACLADLHKRVVEEQTEFAAAFRDMPDVRESYGIIRPDALRFAKERLRLDLERLLGYPSQFEPLLELPLDRLNESLPRHLSTPLQLGQCPILVRPMPIEDCVVNIDYDWLARRFLHKDLKGADVHPSIGLTSKDVVGFRLALEHRANVMLELETMADLLNNHSPDFDTSWELPLHVREDAASGCKVACLDGAIPSASLSQRSKNQLCYDFATRASLTSWPNSATGTPEVCPLLVAPSRRLPKLFQELESFPSFPRVCFASPWTGDSSRGECNVLALFPFSGEETSPLQFCTPAPCLVGGYGKRRAPASSPQRRGLYWGKEGSAARVILIPHAEPTERGKGLGPFNYLLLYEPYARRGSSRSPTKRIPTTPKSGAGSGCSCASRVMTRRAKQQCAFCSQQASEESIRSPTPSSDGLVIDDELVIDEDAVLDEDVEDAASDSASTETPKEAVPTKQGQSGIGGAQPLGAEAIEGAEPSTEPGHLPSASHDKVPDEGAASSTLKAEQDPSEGSLEEEPTAMDHSGSMQDGHTAAGTGDGVPPLPAAESVCYHLWEMGPTRILLRVQAHAVTEKAGERWSVLTKLDYNAKYGAEAFTRAELVRQMAHLVFIPNSRLLRVRVDTTTSKILLTEELGTGDLPTLSSSFRPDELFYRVSYLLGQVSELQPGHYILTHKKGQATVDVLKTAQDKGSLDLHTVVRQRTVALNADCLAAPEEVLPLDPCVVLPVAFQGNQIPATFPVKCEYGRV